MQVAKSDVRHVLVKTLISAMVCSAVLVGVTACGGGGGGPKDQVLDVKGVALFTTAGAAMTLDVGTTSVYKIGGGGNGSAFVSYSAVSSNPDVLTASVEGANLTLISKKGGAATVTVRDSTGGTVEIKVASGNITSLAIQAPTSVNLATGTTGSYKITGGTGPYTAISSNLGVVNPVVSGTDNTLILTGLASGGAQIVVYDAKGASATLTAAINSTSARTEELFSTAPSFISLSMTGVAPTYQIGGGTPPYSVTSNSPDIIEIVPGTANFTVKGKATGFGTIAIKDSVGASTSISVSIVSGKVTVPFYTTAPASIVTKANTPLSFTVTGGSEPYTATISDSSVASVSLVGSKLNIVGLATGSANIVIRDAVGALTAVSLTVPNPNGNQQAVALYSTAPSAVVLQTSTTSTFNIGGGVGPYTATSSNGAVASVVVNGSGLAVTGTTAGNANIVVKDAAGSAITISVSIGSGKVDIPFYTSAPTAIVAQVGSVATYSIAGGNAPYTASSSDVSVASVGLTGSNVTITGKAAGSASIVVRDGVGATSNIAVTVPNPATPQQGVALFSTSPSSITVKPATTSTFVIGGGTAPYTSTSSNTSITTTSVSGNSLGITSVANGVTSVVVKDAVGSTVSIFVAVQ